MTDAIFEQFNSLELDGVKLIRLLGIEGVDLTNARAERSYREYCWTMVEPNSDNGYSQQSQLSDSLLPKTA